MSGDKWASLQAAGLPAVGECVADKYRVDHVLGAGGMGAVLAATHIVLGSPVALKVLLPNAAKLPGAVERFVREARAAAVLRGEHVARVLDVGALPSGIPYLVMEYLTGHDLGREVATRGPLPVAEAARYLTQVCDAMAEAHSLGIVHRDLKPANLFLAVRPNGTRAVKVLDFGLAKVLDTSRGEAAESSLTATGVVIGTPHYMPPEQIRGLKLADTRSDIWSLGIIAYELVTGTRPFLGRDAMVVIAAIVADPPAPPASLRPDLPPALNDLILRCLEKTPDRRPQTVADLAAALAPFAQNPLLPAVSTGNGEPPRPLPEAAKPSVEAQMKTVLAGPPSTQALSVESAPLVAPAVRAGNTTTLSLGTAEVHAKAPQTGSRAWYAGRGRWVAITAAALALTGIVVVIELGASDKPRATGADSGPTGSASSTGAPTSPRQDTLLPGTATTSARTSSSGIAPAPSASSSASPPAAQEPTSKPASASHTAVSAAPASSVAPPKASNTSPSPATAPTPFNPLEAWK